jgi:serine/threonine protein kinase
MKVMRGGMGRVYVSFDIALDQTVAIKTISKEFADGALSKRFLSEAQT